MKDRVRQILVIEDVDEMANLMTLYIRKEGLDNTRCISAEEALVELGRNHFDLIVLDLNLPGLDGLEFLKFIRRTYTIPVLIVSARGTEEDMVGGLELGADDYLPKPFSPRIFVARIKALLRRAEIDIPSSVILFGPFTLDTRAFSLSRDGQRISLSVKQMELLIRLARSPGETFTPEVLYSELWGRRYGDKNTVAVHVQRIRRRIEDDPSSPVYLKTVFGQGYLFEIPQEAEGVDGTDRGEDHED